MEYCITFNFRETNFANELLHLVKAYRINLNGAADTDAGSGWEHSTWTPTELDETRQADEDSYCVTPC